MFLLLQFHMRPALPRHLCTPQSRVDAHDKFRRQQRPAAGAPPSGSPQQKMGPPNGLLGSELFWARLGWAGLGLGSARLGSRCWPSGVRSRSRRLPQNSLSYRFHRPRRLAPTITAAPAAAPAPAAAAATIATTSPITAAKARADARSLSLCPAPLATVPIPRRALAPPCLVHLVEMILKFGDAALLQATLKARSTQTLQQMLSRCSCLV